MWVTIGSGEGEGLSVRVEGERFLVGSGQESQLMVSGPGIAPLHAYFQVRDDGVVELHPLEGDTYVNGHKIEGATHIKGGEEIRIGETVLRPSVEDPAEEARTLHEAEGEGPAEPAPVVRVETEGQTVEVVPGEDTDGDGTPDALVTVDGIDLVVAIDLDGDRFADQVLRIGPDAAVREQPVGGWFSALDDPGDQ